MATSVPPYSAEPVWPSPPLRAGASGAAASDVEDGRAALLARGLARVAADRADPVRARRRGLEAAARATGRSVAEVERSADAACSRAQRDPADAHIRNAQRGVVGWRTRVVADDWPPGRCVSNDW